MSNSVTSGNASSGAHPAREARFPVLYEINTACWLRELSEQAGRPLSLASVPDAPLDEWQRLGITHLWLMGVWSSGPLARAQALADPGQSAAYSAALPGWTEEDIRGSPYAIADYRVPAAFGCDDGLEQFRQRLNRLGLRLVLDFVPNHLGLDHRWLRERPGLFVQSAAANPAFFREQTSAGPRWLAYGRDPYFPPWRDTAQLDYRRPETRDAMSQLLLSVSRRCDGVRCDMAMLLLQEVFDRTWAAFPPQTPGAQGEFWREAIERVRQTQPEFLFLAEAYWDLEPRLLDLGFDYVYDKTLTDQLVARDSAGIQKRLLAMPPNQLQGSAHFLENHDEPPIASRLSLSEHRAAAMLVLGLPGMRFLHDGQLAGHARRLPVQLLRRPAEPPNSAVQSLYSDLFRALSGSSVGQGSWKLLQPETAWADNPSAVNFVLVQWQTRPLEFDLVVVNLAPHQAQCKVRLEVPAASPHSWFMSDRLSDANFLRSAEQLREGLFLDLPPQGAQLFHLTPV